MRPVEEHLAECLAAVEPLPPLDLALLDAVDCVLAEDVVAEVDLPPFDNSAMDGYAVLMPDVAAATGHHPITLPVIADLPAGSSEELRLPQGAAARIMTGAPVPVGCGAVVPVEWTDGGLARVEIRQAPVPGQFLRRAGEDLRAGDLVLSAGSRLTPRHVSALAAVGRERVAVHPRPRVVVLSTGNELVGPGRPLRFGQVYDANGYGLTAAADELGCIAHHVGVVPDDPRLLMSALEDQLMRADLLVTSGGVSAGAYDSVKEVLARLGTVRFTSVAMAPGMPQGFGTIGPDATPVFCLPGNPVSAMVSFEVFVRPVIRTMWGEARLQRPFVQATVMEGWESPNGRRQYVRGALDVDGGGRHTVRPLGGQGSHLVTDLADATCLVVVPEDVTRVCPGDTLPCMLLDRARR
ncbi:MAG: molybdopterin molybdotransferase MoeA [Actinomycetales bacterium]|nr:molybdopterin molybdotransferase MoeA [Actinomycetales bacterium]